VASVVMTCVLESLNVPVAVNDSSVVGAMVRPVGVTEIDTIVAFVTSSMVEPLVAPSVAVMFVLPGVSPVAIGLVLPMEATAVLEELHVT